jgi:excisionase family DNA binding protein
MLILSAAIPWGCMSATTAPTNSKLIPLSLAERIRSFGRALSVAELARLLNVTTITIHRWVQARRIPHFRIGRTVRFCPTTVARWLQERESVPSWFEVQATDTSPVAA